MFGSRDKTVRRAVLVIHGIGEQRRFEALSDFSLGLIRHGLPERFLEVKRPLVAELWHNYQRAGLELFQHGSATLAHGFDVTIETFETQGRTDARVKCTLPAVARQSQALEIDIYEAYWAPLTGGRTNFVRVLLWLITTTWVTLKNGLVPTDRRPRLGEFFTELFRLALVFVLFLAMLGGIFWAARGLLNSYARFEDDFWAQYDVWSFLLTVIWIYLSTLAVQFVQGALLRTIQLAWYQAMIAGALVLGSGWWIWKADYHSIRDEVWWLTLLILLVVLLHTAFVAYLGDVEVYISGSEAGPNWQARQEIIGRAREKLEYILRCQRADRTPHYDEIVVVGHSLGSVIAYDLLCRVLREEKGEVAKDRRKRIKHLYTIGSPLDKVWYFFRDRTHARNPIYQGILAKLKGVKDEGNPDSPLAELEWTNLWCLTDVISGGLEEYGTEVENVHLASLLWPPLVNHVRYWTSPAVMNRIGERVFETLSKEA